MKAILKRIRLKAQNNIIFVIMVLFFSCTSKEKGSVKEETHYETLDSTSLQANPIAVLPKTDSIKINSSFDLMLAKVEDSLVAWGFTRRTEKLLKTSADFKNHWLLKYYFDKQEMARSKRLYPGIFLATPTDWHELKRIRQVTFQYGNGYVIEEWIFNNKVASSNWERIVHDAQDIDNNKPFRLYWIEGNKLYMVMMKGSTYQRYHQRDIIELMGGHTSLFFKMMAQPFYLPRFKKQVGGANSGVGNNEPYYYQPDTIGHNYHYFWFYKLRDKFKDNELAVNGIHLYTYIYGEKIGEYAKVDEELIALKAKVNFYGLEALNIVGKPKKAIENNFGKAQLVHNGFDVYYHNKTFLILKYQNNKVSWFRYIKTNLALEQIDQLPKKLFRYNENRKIH